MVQPVAEQRTWPLRQSRLMVHSQHDYTTMITGMTGLQRIHHSPHYALFAS